MTHNGIETQLERWAINHAIENSPYFKRQDEILKRRKEQMRKRRKLGKRRSQNMFAKGVMKEHPKNRYMSRGGIRL